MNNTKVALITGASSGIGQAIAQELVKRGIRVYAAARSLPDEFRTDGGLSTLKLDVNDTEAVNKAVAKVIQAASRIDYLVQAAGYGISGAIEDTQTAEARGQMETNFLGTVNLLQPVLRQMRSQKGGLIVQIGSVAGVLAIPYQAYYSASKAAMAALTMALSNEVKPFGIRCMLVQPGDTKTGFTKSRIMVENALKSDYAERCKRSIDKMAADEQKGITAEKSARHIVRKMLRRHPPLVMTIGIFYKLVVGLTRFLPTRFVQWAVGLIYAG